MPANLVNRRLAGGCRVTAIVATATLVFVGCGGPQSPAAAPESSPTAAVTASVLGASATETPTGDSCAGGNLRVADLRLIDDEWQAGLDEARKRAEAWQSDAFLTSLRVGCEVLGPEFRWQATFYSPSLQAYYASDTGETVTSEDDPNKVPELVTDGLSFGVLRRALTKSGYGDPTELTASIGVEVRLNSSTKPFGPPDAPDNVVLYHVAVLHRGEVRDLFVSTTDGSVYRYSF
ncbi:MAG: hypothetical protein ACRDJH_25070 [Thermomicrobiales bacterium]